MKTNVQPNNQHQEIIKYYPDGSVEINLECILTPDHIVRPEMLLLKVEGVHVDVIKLLNVRDHDGRVYLKFRNQKTGNVHELSLSLDPDPNETYYAWWVTSYEYVMDNFKDRESKKRDMGTELEFDF